MRTTRFLITESNIACDPVNRLRFNKEGNAKKPPSQLHGPKNSRAHQPQDGFHGKNVLATESKERERNACTFCNGSYELDLCEAFCAKDINDRKQFTKKKSLYFGCLTKSHISKHCKNRKTCTTCGRSHPTPL